jgi:SAM-dependent methyltransferase
MRMTTRLIVILSAIAGALALSTSPAAAQVQTGGFTPVSGQAGKDVVWVPTPEALVEKMLDMAKVTPKDFVMDLGSGDGRTVIAAARRGARAQGIEFNPDMVALSRRNAAAAGMTERATFVQGDLFETDFSKANVVTLFLLPSINLRLRPAILDMQPGTRVVSNTFSMGDWEADETATIDDCSAWCTALLWIVPARVEGTWQMPDGTLTITQSFQRFGGTLGSAAIGNGRLNGSEISFVAGGRQYTGTVSGDTMKGAGWTATRR